MSKSFVRPPVEDKIINDDGYLTEAWKHWFLDTWQSMDELANEAGVQIPNLTGLQRLGSIYPTRVDALIDTSQVSPGYLVYQSDAYNYQLTPDLPNPPGPTFTLYPAGYYYWDGSAWQTLP